MEAIIVSILRMNVLLIKKYFHANFLEQLEGAVTMDDVFFNSEQVMAFIKSAREYVKKRIELENTYLELTYDIASKDTEEINENLSFVARNIRNMSIDDQVRILKPYRELTIAANDENKKYGKE